MTRQIIGEALAARIYAAEAAIDRAMGETAALAAALPNARADAYLSATTGQRAFSGAAASLSALAEARGHLVDTHNALAALARKLGLQTLAVGPIDKPEDTPPIGGGTTGVATNLNTVNKASPDVVNKSLPDMAKLC